VWWVGVVRLHRTIESIDSIRVVGVSGAGVGYGRAAWRHAGIMCGMAPHDTAIMAWRHAGGVARAH
jgi:hypothetical protein